MNINIRLDERFGNDPVNALRLLTAELGGQLPKVSGYAQNAMAYDIRIAEQDQMVTDLDRPTPWSVSSLRYKKADITVSSPPNSDAPKVPGAAVYMVNGFTRGSNVGADEYLGVQILGGVTAGPKRSEIMMGPSQYRWIDADTVWVPAIGGSAPIDEYGNIPGPVMSAMLSSLGANEYARGDGTSGRRRGSRRPRVYGEFFLMSAGNQGGQATEYDGVYRRYTNANGEEEVEPFIWFIPRAQYQARWQFFERANSEIDMKFTGYINRYLDIALERMRQGR